MKKLAVTLAVTVALSTIALAQSAVTGKWEGQTPNGSSLALDTAAKSATLTGTMTVGTEKSPLTDGKVSKNTLSFTVSMEGGTEAFTGEVSGDAMKIWMDSRGPNAAITLKRVKPAQK